MAQPRRAEGGTDLRVLRLLWSTLGDYYYEILPFTAVNLLWVVCLVVPSLLAGALLRAFPSPVMLLPALLITLIGIPPANAALFAAGRSYADGYNIGPRDFLAGFRRYFWRAWQLAAVDVLMGGLLLANIWFYGVHAAGGLKLVALVWLYALLFWLLVQPYLFGLLVYQRDKRLGTTLRNAALLAGANLGYSLGLLVVALIFLVLSVGLGLPMLILSGTVGAIWFTRALDVLLAKYPGARRDEANPPAAEPAGALSGSAGEQ